MRRLLLILALAIVIHNAFAITTIVVGDCAKGDYEFNNLLDALEEAEDHSDVNILVCGTRELEHGKTIHVNDIVISGGEIKSDEERLRIYGDDITLSDVNFIHTRIVVVSEGTVTLKNVSTTLPEGWSYCIDLNTEGDVHVIDVHVSGCRYGVYVRRAKELNVWSVFTEDGTTAIRFEPQNVDDVYLNPIKVVEERVVERAVEKNIPVREVVYRVPPEIQRELESCEELVSILQRKKSDLEGRVAELTEKLEDAKKAKTYPEIWTAIGLLVLGLAVGYVAGRM